MPLRPRPNAAPTEAPASGLRARPTAPAGADAPGDETSDEGFPWGGALAGGAALTGAALLARSPRAPQAVKTGLEYANALRQQLMLSGFAPLKSFLGNIGAATAESAETRSLGPLKELLSMETVRDIGSAFKAGRNVAPAGSGVTLPGPLGFPGRIMGAVDEATRNALQRSGMTGKAAERAVFQAPLPKRLESALDSPVARYAIPFRRTPFNQFIEGWEATKGQHPAVLAGYTGAGAAHGAATADERYPLTVPFGVAAAAKYGLPYGLAAIAGRLMAGGKGAGNIPSNVLPVSEYGLSQSIEDPTAPFVEPSALRALKQLIGR